MPWPPSLFFWRRQPDDTDDTRNEGKTRKDLPWYSSKPSGSWENNLNSTDWSHYTSPQTITFSIITTATTLALIRVYKTYLRRVPNVAYLKPGVLRKRSYYGYVTRVGDGDNFHLYHTPGGRMAGWGWLPGRQVRSLKGETLKGKTMHVRIAGIDAPELAHFGRPAQPYGQEALDWLRGTLLHQYVRVYPYAQDQYQRVVSSVYSRRFLFFKSDVGLNMLKQGLATVYEAKVGSEFGGREEQYRAAEEQAKNRGTGMWKKPGRVARMLGAKEESLESPRDYKTRMAHQEKTSDMAK